MKENRFPYVSIVSVNYNGKAFLKDLFDSLLSLDYPEEKIELIMVDNASTDASDDYVKRYFPNVKIISSDKNRGYAGGNNLGIKNARHPFVALINNDMVVEGRWLRELARTLEKNGASAVGSKVLFFYEYVPIKLSSKGSFRISDLGIKKEAVGAEKEGFAQKSIKIKGATAGRDENGDLFYDIDSEALVYLPIIEGHGRQVFSFKNLKDTGIEASMAGKGLLKTETGSYFFIEIGSVPSEEKIRLINSAGIEINSGLYSRDRGYEEIDKAQFDKSEELFGLSGSSLLIDKALFEDVGYFDETFFTYYEDIDLFYRARLKGHKMYYNPASVAYHYHCGTGEEWSYSFTYHVLKNRLLMIYKNSPMAVFVKNYARFFASAVFSLLGYLKARLKGADLLRPDIKIRFKVFFILVFLLIQKTPQRFSIRRGSRVEDSIISNWFKDF